MWRKIIFVGFLVLIVTVSFWWVKKGVKNQDDLLNVGDERLIVPSVMEKDFEDVGIVVSDDASKAELKDVTAGSSRGVASVEKDGLFFVHYVVADLPELSKGFYEGWLVNSKGDVLYTGKLENQKGGWVLEFRIEKDISDYKKIVITEEIKDDQKPEKHILEGSL
jgi:hypothetical protein